MKAFGFSKICMIMFADFSVLTLRYTDLSLCLRQYGMVHNPHEIDILLGLPEKLKVHNTQTFPCAYSI